MIIPQHTLNRFVTIHDPSKAYNGYVLYSPHMQRNVWLIDMRGQFVHTWRLPRPLRFSGTLLPNGNMVCGGMVPEGPGYALPGSGGEVLELDWDSNVVWKYEDPYINSHEIARMKNGHTLICHMRHIPLDLAAKIKGGVPGSERDTVDGVMWGDVLQEISPDGKVVWECPVYELLDPEIDIMCPLCPRNCWTYINSNVVLPDGNILVSLRFINTIAIIDKKKREIKWRWGSGELGHQHNATMLDNGNILVFDNGLHRSGSGVGIGSYSRVLEINPKTNKIEWEYKDKCPTRFHTCINGSAERLPNGNTLICESTKGRLFEVTHNKEIVWEFFNPFHVDYKRTNAGWINIVFRAIRYSPEYEGLKGRCLDPDRLEWVLQEKGKPVYPAREEEEETVRTRLGKLGY